MARKGGSRAPHGTTMASDLLRHAVEHFGAPVCLCDPQDRIVFVNQAWRTLNASVLRTTAPGRKFANLLRAGLKHGIYPEAVGREKEWLAERMARRGSAGGAVFEQQLGNGIRLLVREERLPDGSTLTLALDVTEHRRGDEALRRAKERLEIALWGSKACVWDTNLKTGEVDLSEGWAELLGMPPGPVSTTLKALMELVHPDDLVPAVRHSMDVLKGQREQYHFEHRVRTHSGEWKWILSSGRVIERDPQTRRAVRMSGVNVDITERKRVEQALRELTQDLESRVRERTAELETALRDTEAFSYSVSSDQRAALRAIGGVARVVTEQEGSRLSEAGRRKIEEVEASAREMELRADRLLTLARLSRASPAREEIDVAALATSVLEELRVRYPHASAVVAELPPANADPTVLRQALVSLADNAFKYSAKSETPRVEIGWSEAEQAYYVRDNGVGFEMESAERLFGTLHQLQPETEVSGTGIELALVRRVIERHGGRIWAESAPGKGATFYFTLDQALPAA